MNSRSSSKQNRSDGLLWKIGSFVIFFALLIWVMLVGSSNRLTTDLAAHWSAWSSVYIYGASTCLILLGLYFIKDKIPAPLKPLFNIFFKGLSYLLVLVMFPFVLLFSFVDFRSAKKSPWQKDDSGSGSDGNNSSSSFGGGSSGGGGTGRSF